MSNTNGKNYNEGDVVSYIASDGEQDTARVRRVYDNSLELVNHDRGYQDVETAQVIEIVGEIIPGTYTCRLK